LDEGGKQTPSIENAALLLGCAKKMVVPIK
jgi:hypothetical protein